MREIEKGAMIFVLGGAMGLAELVGNIIISLIIHRLPRRTSTITSFLLSIGSCFSFIFYGFTADSTKLNCSFCFGSRRIKYNIRNYANRDSLLDSDFQYLWVRVAGLVCKRILPYCDQIDGVRVPLFMWNAGWSINSRNN